jgi:hypothetical protein
MDCAPNPPSGCRHGDRDLITVATSFKTAAATAAATAAEACPRSRPRPRDTVRDRGRGCAAAAVAAARGWDRSRGRALGLQVPPRCSATSTAVATLCSTSATLPAEYPAPPWSCVPPLDCVCGTGSVGSGLVVPGRLVPGPRPEEPARARRRLRVAWTAWAEAAAQAVAPSGPVRVLEPSSQPLSTPSQSLASCPSRGPSRGPPSPSPAAPVLGDAPPCTESTPLLASLQLSSHACASAGRLAPHGGPGRAPPPSSPGPAAPGDSPEHSTIMWVPDGADGAVPVLVASGLGPVGSASLA